MDRKENATLNGGVETTIDRGKNKVVWENKYPRVRFDSNSSWSFLTQSTHAVSVFWDMILN